MKSIRKSRTALVAELVNAMTGTANDALEPVN